MTTKILVHNFESNCVDVEKPRSSTAVGATLLQIAADNGRSYFSLLKKVAMLRCGARCPSFDEFVRQRLYDNKMYAGVDKKAFVGLKASLKIWLQANYRLDRFALVENKIGIDCAESKSGDLLIFEADNSMIVHNMDPPDIFPYKSAEMRRIFNAFATMLSRRASTAHAYAAA